MIGISGPDVNPPIQRAYYSLLCFVLPFVSGAMRTAQNVLSPQPKERPPQIKRHKLLERRDGIEIIGSLRNRQNCGSVRERSDPGSRVLEI
jgi:hypothetical protein